MGNIYNIYREYVVKSQDVFLFTYLSTYITYMFTHILHPVQLIYIQYLPVVVITIITDIPFYGVSYFKKNSTRGWVRSRFGRLSYYYYCLYYVTNIVHK